MAGELKNFKKDGQRPEEPPQRQDDERICPFMSDSRALVACSPRCKLYRDGKGKFTCYFMEMQAMSWSLKEMSRRGGY